MTLEILYIDDDIVSSNSTKELLETTSIAGDNLSVRIINDFDIAMHELEQRDYSLVILDLCEGPAEDSNTNQPGSLILRELKTKKFVPVIFFTGLPHAVRYLESTVVKIVSKGDGFVALQKEIKKIFETGIPNIQHEIDEHVRETLRSYFWDFVDTKYEMFKHIGNEVSLNYLLLRRLSISISKDQMIKRIDCCRESLDIAHPMEVYIYPPLEGEFGTGDILKIDSRLLIILTPACDFVIRDKRSRKADRILVAECTYLKDLFQCKEYLESKIQSEEAQKNLTKCKGNREEETRLNEELKTKRKKCKDNENKLTEIFKKRVPRYFFLPKTPFIDNCIVDFQKVESISYDELKGYEIVATLDSPFVQALTSSFNNYYARIGFPDYDVKSIFENI